MQAAALASAPESILHSFMGQNWSTGVSADAAYPDGPLLAARGAFYGATAAGGQHDFGAIFELKPPARPGGAWQYSIVHSFSGPDGVSPSGHLLYWHDAIYGTTASYNAPVEGTVYRLLPRKTGWTLETLYRFPGYPQDGGTPRDGVIAVGDSLYGTNAAAAPYFQGGVFRLRPPAGGRGPWRETMVHAFTGGADGAHPLNGLVYLSGALFGTAAYGGSSNAGVVYELTRAKTGWQLSILHSFFGQGDGANPGALIAANGALYGISSAGGSQYGNVFCETPSGNGWSFRVIYDFAGGTSGATPVGDLVDIGGTLYGTTQWGGAPGQGAGQGYGTIFAITQSFYETTLHAFSGGTTDGAYPSGGLLPYAGRLLGTTGGGGAFGAGTVFSVRP